MELKSATAEPLGEVFERSSSASKRKTLGEFFKLQMQQSEHISDYIFRIHQKQRLLKSFEIKLDDEITLTVMLTGLPGRFEQLITVINANEDITLDKAEQLLLEYDERHGKKTDHEYFGILEFPTNEFACSVCSDSHHLQLVLFCSLVDETLQVVAGCALVLEIVATYMS